MLVAVPVGLYLFLYQRSRIEAATIRNFRALDAAAERVDQVLTRLSSVVVGSSFGVSPEVLDEVTKLLTDGNATPSGCDGNGGIASPSWDAPPAFPRALFRSRRPTAAQRLEFRYWRAADTLFKSNESNKGATEALWNQLHCLIDTHRKFTGPGGTVTVAVDPVPRMALRPPARCDDWTADSPCIRLRELLEAAPCPDSSAGSARLSAGGDGMEATVADCRRIEERYDDLHQALNSFVGADSVIHALDFFGTRSAADLDQLMNEATGYLSQFFDSHLIADTDGLILFEADTASASTPAAENQAATPGFSRYVDISELLRTESSRSGWPWAGDADAGAAAPSASFFRGRSFMRVVGVGDIGLRVFVHPFILDGVAVSDGAQRDARAGADLRPTRPTFYLVGIVDDREFRNAAMRLRLERVTSATLVLLGLLSFIPLMWYWTAGERAVVGRFALLAVCVLPAVGMVLFTVLACGLVTNRADEHALDGAMAHLSARIVDLFDQELGAEIDRLQRDVPDLMARARREELRPRRTKTRLSVAVADERRLTRLEQAFYCDDADRNLDYDPGRPEAWSAFLLNTEGRQQVCLSEPRRGRPARTPPLDLQFREYFRHPRDGALWRSPAAQRQRVSCRIGDRQDAESFVPCLVDALPELSKRLFLVPGATGPGVPYFLERIDSVIGGGRTSILAVNTGVAETPVAVAAVSLNTLDRMVPPQHIDFAVVDRKTGRTLFHSDDDLAMTTNFVEVAGGDSGLRSLLGSGTSDTVDLDYAGVPIFAPTSDRFGRACRGR